MSVSFGFNILQFIVVSVAQLVEPWIVIPVVVGSSPIVHPIIILQDEVVIPASVVKLVYTPDLGSGAARRESSSLSTRTIFIGHRQF